MWRGIRSTLATFGVPVDDLDKLTGIDDHFVGFTATTISRQVAVDQFTLPELAGGAALLRLRLPVGKYAAWLRPISMGRQLELLLPDRLRYRITSHTVEDLLVVAVEVGK